MPRPAAAPTPTETPAANPLAGFDPVVADWFRSRFRSPTEPQARGWPLIAAGREVLITAPTGSGKTLAAFLAAIDSLLREARAGTLRDETRVVYVSPLRALSADIRANLEIPLAEIRERAARAAATPAEPPTDTPADTPTATATDTPTANAAGPPTQPPAEIRTGLRTGDTPPAERARLLRRPPHLLITTPESLYLLLTSRRGRESLATARTVIVDEIHALARDRRGSHLALTLERLDRAAGRKLQRLGLSATVHPTDAIARFLSPAGAGPEIVAAPRRRDFDLAVEVPGTELGAVASHEVMEDLENRIAALIAEHRTTLVFVNTRRMAERLTNALRERLDRVPVLAHHGSLDREARLDAEARLRAGEVRALVATASLELGIDIGAVDLVCQLGSPRSLSTAVQRIGRSGHWRDATPKGRLFPTTRDDLVECAALAGAVAEGELDRLRLPEGSRDLLAQQIVAEAAATPDEPWPLDDLFRFVRGAWPYRALDRATFDEVVAMLSEGFATTRGRRGAFLHRNRVRGTVRARRGARLAATLNGGAIPETAQYQVVAEPEDRVIGQVDEDFAVESYRGDVFLLGATAWRIRRIARGQVRVEDARGAAPTIPFWRGEAPGRTDESSVRVSRLREEVAGTDAATARRLLRERCFLSEAGADQVVRYLAAGKAALGAVPTRRRVVAERFFDESGGMQLVLHAPFGSRVNRAWGLALRKRFCRSFDLELQAAATDDGVNLSLTDLHSFELASVFRFLAEETLTHTLTQALLGAPLFEIRWRHTLTRALAVPRRRGGRRVPPPIQRMLADDLLAAVFPDQAACAENLAGEVRVPKHPLVDEAIAEALYETLDRDGLAAVLRGLADGSIETLAVDSAEASPFAAEILNANPFAFLDPAPLEERRARAVRMRRTLPPELDAEAVLDPEAIARADAEARLPIRDPDEAHDALLTRGVLREPPPDRPPAQPPKQPDAGEPDREPEVRAHLEALAAEGRAVSFPISPPESSAAGEGRLWAATERLPLVARAWPEAALDEALHPALPPDGPPPLPEGLPDTRAGAIAEILRGVLDCSGPRTVRELEAELALPARLLDEALGLLEGEGTVLRGAFRPPSAEPTAAGPTPAGPTSGGRPVEWCHRRVLARIHRLTLAALRRESAPVSAARFLDFLVRWQRAAPTARRHGPNGVREALAQLSGFEAPAAAWESQLLPLRVAGYRRDWLDGNCLSGEVAWGRVSPPAPSPPGPSPSNSASNSPPNSPSNSRAGTPAPGAARRPPRPTRSAPIALLPRADLPFWLSLRGERAEPPRPSAAAGRVLEHLERRGASFFADLEQASGLVPAALEEALWELAAAGRVTADGFDNLRALLDPRRRSAVGRYRRRKARYSPGRWAPLAAADGGNDRGDGRGDGRGDDGGNDGGNGSGNGRAPGGDADRGNRDDRDRAGGNRNAGARDGDREHGNRDDDREHDDREHGDRGREEADSEALARRLLDRWGVLFRDLLKRERLENRWRLLQRALRRLEMRGEVVGGQFVTTFPGEQFALPAAVEALRRLRRDGQRDRQRDRENGAAAPAPLVIGAADPLNLSGILLPGPRIPSSSLRLLRLHRGALTPAPPGTVLYPPRTHRTPPGAAAPIPPPNADTTAPAPERPLPELPPARPPEAPAEPPPARPARPPAG